MLSKVARKIWRFRASKTGAVILWVVVIAFLGQAAVSAYADYQSVTPTLHMIPFTGALVFLIAKQLVLPVKWRLVLNADQKSLSFSDAAYLFYVSNLSSYIPGGVWQFVDMGYRATEEGEAQEAVAHSIIYVQGTTVASAFFMAAALGTIVLPQWRAVFILITLSMVVGVLYAPVIVDKVQSVLSHWDVTLSPYPVSRTVLLKLFGVAVVGWMFNGVFLYLLTAALYTVPVSYVVPVTAIGAAAWAVGFLVLVIPGGLGIREGTIITLLSQLVPMPVAIAASIIARVLSLLAEVLMAGLFMLIYNYTTNDGDT